MPAVTPVVDLNADLGEGLGVWRLGDDEALLDVVTSANVACGFHAGDPATLRRVCAVAAERGVAVGAQVSYRDLAGFGRRFIAASYDEVRDDVIYQIGALDAFCRVAGTRVAYLKPHGALYHACSTVPDHGQAVVDAAREWDPGFPVVAAAGSPFLRLVQEAGLPAVAEAFADRGYREDGTLVPRGEPGALVDDPDDVAARAVAMVHDGHVTSGSGVKVSLDARSLCLHSDTPGAVELARGVRAALDNAGVTIRAFV